MKISLPLFTLTLICLTACSHNESTHSVSEAAAITASDIQSTHLETTTTLDRIADEINSASNASGSNSHPARPASVPVQHQ
ncbi:hypothetical protein DKK71_08580 [Snodgrassella alvi]|uniref:hypothetical protein n=1 Tax=Snodgrassella alvi TaxID=1196083 RepID=UPI000D785740|nr:hypothetical protein [Snodgrassella alvi]PXY96279.1 hypothetical protein DKK71_08580 [Snodgrassella alvi]